MRASFGRKYEFLILVVFLIAFCHPPRGVAEAVQPDAQQQNPLASKYSALDSPAAATTAQQAGSSAPLSYDDSTANEKLALSLIKTAEKAGSFAKTVTESIGDYVKEKQIERRQNELVQQFYFNVRSALKPLSLSPSEYEDLVSRVEDVYIRDGDNGAKLDIVTFRDMPVIVRKEYSEMMLARTQNGQVETYYINGAVKTRWQIKDGKKQGPAITYYEDGEIQYIDIYDNGNRVNRKKYDHEGKLEFEQNYSYDVSETPSSPAAAAPVPGVPPVETKPADASTIESAPAPKAAETSAPL
ncbi:MAG TPA: hypothetical protein VL688_05680 [Verrucomicrobiae bacterium]|nr:hypothetical protein [Verrucomicrobiae bacterium]